MFFYTKKIAEGDILVFMRLQHIEIAGFKSFAKKSTLSFETPVTAVVGPNGSGKSNVVEAFRFVMGEQSMKSMRGKSGADLIFRGGSGTPKLSRAAVSITFDNSDKVFNFQPAQSEQASSKNTPVLFDTITFTRELFADGTSRYLMNGTEIRLKAMVELLSSVNIGTSSHHIISQGEADGILRANPRDRREILEDALGLKIYHYRIRESEQKLAKATTTLKEVQSLRRELAPHIKFLEKQVEKIEKGRAIRTELEQLSLQYLAVERAQLAVEDTRLQDAMKLIANRKLDLQIALKSLPEQQSAVDQSAGERARFIAELQKIREDRRGLESRMSRLQGMAEAHHQLLARQATQPATSVAISFAPTEYHQLLSDLDFFLVTLRDAQTLEDAKRALAAIEPIIARLKSREPKSNPHEAREQDKHDAIAETAAELANLEHELRALITKEESTAEALSALEREREQMLVGNQDAIRRRYEVVGELAQCESELQILAISKASFVERKGFFDTELKEAGFLFGPTFVRELEAYEVLPELNMHDTKRSIDRLKIRLDEHAGIGSEVVGEYESTKERDAFLSREVTDIENSIRNLESLIIELKKILDEQFTKGVAVINERFGEFFKTMFGGGSAFLSITMEKKRKRKGDELDEYDEDTAPEDQDQFFERGIDVHVNLPEKKVKELTMLSGGERSLVSIALLFAISQVNPPPFLVLDETDAALDEANSRRYGDMIEVLSAYSQLIVVTHNRETMSRASVLYGVTLGTDGGSKLLSIKFDEAVKVAK